MLDVGRRLSINALVADKYSLVAGVRVQAIGNIWAAFSQASGETVLLNDEGAAILEILAQASASADDVLDALATDSGVGRNEIAATLTDCWAQLAQAGLVRHFDGVPDRPR